MGWWWVTGRGRDPQATSPCFLAEAGQVGVQSRRAAGVQEQHLGTLGEVALASQIDQTGHGLAGVHGVKQDAFGLGQHLDGFDHGVRGRE